MALKAGEGRYGITRKMFLKLKNSSDVSWNYSTQEVNTGQKWIDGRTIYSKVWDFGNSPLLVAAGNTWVDFDNDLRGVDGIINGWWLNTDLSAFNNGSFFVNKTTNKLQMLSTRTQTNIYVGKIVLLYVKSE